MRRGRGRSPHDVQACWRQQAASRAKRRPPMKKCKPVRKVLAPQISIGLDLGADEAQACVLGRDGGVLQEWGLRLTPEELRRYFGDSAPAVVVLEMCTAASWVARQLEEMGYRVLACNARRLKLIASSTLKTDRLDAEVLARMARLAQLDPELVESVTVRTRETQLQRSELRGREQLVGARTRLINFVRSVLRADALPVPRCTADRFVTKLDPAKLPEDVWAVIEGVVKCIADLTSQLAETSKRVREMASKRAEVQRMTEVDGVGQLTALAVVLCVEDPTRFVRSRDVGPYLGLIPRLRQSSQEEWRGPITKQGDEQVRRLLVQAALCLLRSKRDSALKRWALAVAERRGRKKAVVALARKLAVVLHQVWVSGEAYVPFPATQHGAAA